MRSLILLSTLLLAGALCAQTVPAPTDNTAPAPQKHRMMRGQDGQRGFDRMAQQLNLTDQQKTQIQGIFQTQRQQAQAIRQDTSLTPEQKQDKLKALRSSTHQQVQGVLTPEQQQQMKQFREQHQGMRKGMGPGKGQGGPGMAALNLTDQQKTQMQSIMQTQRQQMQSIRQDSSLTAEQRQQKMQELRQSTHQQMMGILTPEQQQQWQSMPHRRGFGTHQGPPPSTPPSGF